MSTTSTTWRSHLRRGAVLAVTGALAATVLTQTSASAAPAPQRFAFVDYNTLVLSTGASTGSGATPVSPSNVRVFSYDASQDGATVVAGICSGSVAQCTDKAPATKYDATYALVLVHRGAPGDASKVVSRVLSTDWDANPVIAADGVFYVADGVLYKYSVSGGDWLAGTLSKVTPAGVAPTSSEYVDALAVSSDESKVAMIFRRSSDGLNGRVLAASIADGTTGSYFTTTYTGSTQPSGNTFVFDGSTLLYAETSGTAIGATVAAALSGTPNKVTTSTTVPSGSYALRQSGGTWWSWTDVGGTAVPRSTSDPIAGSFATYDARPDGSTTFGYVPVDNDPPQWSATASGVSDVRTPVRAAIGLSQYTQAWGRTVAFCGYGLYEQTSNLVSFSVAGASEIDKGVLQRSTDGVHFAPVSTTSGARPFGISGKRCTHDQYFFTGSTPRLARNTWFRWSFPGDYSTAGATSRTVQVTVSPAITTKVTKRGARRIVSGSATRVGGTITLYRKGSKGYRFVASARINSKGAYGFGRRILSRGSYRVTTTADRSWASGSRTFSV